MNVFSLFAERSWKTLLVGGARGPNHSAALPDMVIQTQIAQAFFEFSWSTSYRISNGAKENRSGPYPHQQHINDLPPQALQTTRPRHSPNTFIRGHRRVLVRVDRWCWWWARLGRRNASNYDASCNQDYNTNKMTFTNFYILTTGDYCGNLLSLQLLTQP